MLLRTAASIARISVPPRPCSSLLVKLTMAIPAFGSERTGRESACLSCFASFEQPGSETRKKAPTQNAATLKAQPWIVAIGRRTVLVAPPMISRAGCPFIFPGDIRTQGVFNALAGVEFSGAICLGAKPPSSHPEAKAEGRMENAESRPKPAQSRLKATLKPGASQEHGRYSLVFLLFSSCSARLIRTGSREHPGGSTEPRCAFDRTGAAGDQSF
jgi:hypothetical protein